MPLLLGRARSAALLFFFAAACDGSPSDRLGRTRQAIISGQESDPSQDATVMIVAVDVPNNVRIGICTGTLIAPTLVVTARHCVAVVNPANINCLEDGTPISGGEVHANLDAQSFFIFTGNTRPQFIGQRAPDLDMAQWKPASQAAEVIDDRASTLCSHDIALLLLKTPITDRPIAAVRLDGDATAQEKMLTVGWGVTVPELEPQKRQQRSGVIVDRVGPDPSYPLLTKTEFSFNESICLGDSGGPVFDQETKALVGVVSRGGNGEVDTGGASTCLEARNLATKVSSFKQLLTDSFTRVGAQPKLEEKPDDGCSIGRATGGSRSGGGGGTSSASALALLLVGVLSIARRIRSNDGEARYGSALPSRPARVERGRSGRLHG